MGFDRCNRTIPILMVLVGALTIGACAALDRDECKHIDWQTLGHEDGARGYPASRIEDRREACAPYGVAPDVASYEAGRVKGLVQWCVPRNGYHLGTSGNPYNGVCPQSSAPAFLEAFRRGKALHGYEKEVKRSEADYMQMQGQLGTLDAQVKSLEAEIISDGISPRRRMMLRQEIRRLEAERRIFLNDMEDMALTLDDMRANFERMEAQHPYP